MPTFKFYHNTIILLTLSLSILMCQKAKDGPEPVKPNTSKPYITTDRAALNSKMQDLYADVTFVNLVENTAQSIKLVVLDPAIDDPEKASDFFTEAQNYQDFTSLLIS